jgi:hypothetical protein
MPCVYILTNPAIPGLLKIGYTGGTAADRAAEISRGTGVPSPYAVHWHMETVSTESAYDVEQAVHRKLTHQRHNRAREFFTTPIAVAIDTIERIAYQRGAIANNLAVVARMLKEEDESAKRAAAQRAANEVIRIEQQRVAAVKKAEQDAVDAMQKQRKEAVKAAEKWMLWPFTLLLGGFVLMGVSSEYKNNFFFDLSFWVMGLSTVLLCLVFGSAYIVKLYCWVLKKPEPFWAGVVD